MPQPSMPPLLAGILAVQAAFQTITTANGRFFNFVSSSVVLDPVALDTTPVSPFVVIGGNLESLRVEKQLTEFTGGHIKDTLTLPTVARLDAGGTDFARKLTAWTEYLADVEWAMATAAFGADQALNKLTVTAYPHLCHAPAMGLANTSIVIAQIDLAITFKNRVNGQP